MLRHALVPLAAASLLIGSQATQQQGGSKDIFGRTLPPDEKRLDRKEAFLGGWRLVQMVDQELPEAGRSEEGYVVFTPEYMALEWHVMWDKPGGRSVDDDFSSGIHTWDIDSLGTLTSTIVIGAFLDDDRRLDYERPGNAWTFRARVTAGMLTLERTDGSRMTFARHDGGLGTGKDIFGRTIGGGETLDLFGREVKPKPKDEDQETDGGGD